MDSEYRPQAINIVHTNVTALALSRYSVLDWINLQLQPQTSEVRKVEDLCTGSVYCQLMEKLFGQGTIPMKRVKFNSQVECEYIQNFKLLQVAFNKLGVDRSIPIEKLTKGRYHDNYDFIQWFKMFYDANEPFGSRRLDVPKAKNFFPSYDNELRLSPKAHRTTVSVPVPLRRPKPMTTLTGHPVPLVNVVNALKVVNTANVENTVNEVDPTASSRTTMADLHSIQLKFQELTGELSRAVKTIDVICKERNFYKGKVTEVCDYIDTEARNPMSDKGTVVRNISKIVKEPYPTKVEVDKTKAVATSVKSELVGSSPRGPFVSKKSTLESVEELDEESIESGGIGTAEKVGGDSIQGKIPKNNELANEEPKMDDASSGPNLTNGIGDTEPMTKLFPK